MDGKNKQQLTEPVTDKLSIMKKIFLYTTIILLFFSCTKNDQGNTVYVTTGTGGSLAKFAIAGNYLYTVENTGLRIFDISSAGNPVYKNVVNLGLGIETIYPFKDKLFIGSTSVVYIYSIVNPANPTLISTATSQQVFRRCDPVVAKDSVAYATLRSSSICGGGRSVLSVIDIRSITNPIETYTLTMKEPMGLGYWGNSLYVCDTATGMQVFDINNGFLPKLITTLPDEKCLDVIPYDDELICWTANGITIYDITNRNNPVKITTIK